MPYERRQSTGALYVYDEVKLKSRYENYALKIDSVEHHVRKQAKIMQGNSPVQNYAFYNLQETCGFLFQIVQHHHPLILRSRSSLENQLFFEGYPKNSVEKFGEKKGDNLAICITQN